VAVASAGHMQVCTSLQTDNHTSNPPLSFLQAGCPSCCPTNSVKALKGVRTTKTDYLNFSISYGRQHLPCIAVESGNLFSTTLGGWPRYQCLFEASRRLTSVSPWPKFAMPQSHLSVGLRYRRSHSLAPQSRSKTT